MTTKLNDLSKLSLAATLTGLTSCAYVDVPARPFYMQGNLDNVLVQPVDHVVAQATHNDLLVNPNPNYRSLVSTNPSYDFNVFATSEANLEQLSGTNLMNYSLQLPTEFAIRDTYFDTGLVQIAFGDETLRFRPLYSQSYDVSIRDHFRTQKTRERETRSYDDFSFKNDNLSALSQDDPERIKHDESAAIAALARLVWGWSALQPIRVVADDVRSYSNDAVQSVFGSHSEIDYNSGRLVFGFTGIKADYVDVELNAWADVGDFDHKGLILQLNFHGRGQ